MRGLLLTFVLFLALAGPAGAATIVVNETADTAPGGDFDGHCSLREAVINAGSNPGVIGCAPGAGADVIIVPPGYYVLRLVGADEDAGMTGDLDLAGTIEIRGAGRHETIIDAASLDRVFHVLAGANVTVRSLTITGGERPGGDPELFSGGGIFNAGGVLTLRDVLVTGNTTQQNGGGVASSGPLTISDSAILHNEAGGDGGGVFGDAITITESLVAGNGAGTAGGGIHASAALSASQTRISANTANSGGGVFTVNGPLSLTDLTVNDNLASGGGGLYLDSTFADDLVQRLVVRGNTATGGGGGILLEDVEEMSDLVVTGNSSLGDGGGLMILSDGHTISRSTISDNKASIDGGGVLHAGDTTFVNVTISGNASGETGGGGGGISNVAFNTLTLLNVTLAGNRSLDGGNVRTSAAQTEATNTLFIEDDGGDQCAGNPLVDGGNNLVFDSDVGDDCGFTQTSNIHLGPLGNNGGPTPTHAIAQGDDAVNGGLNCPSPDQRGVPRPQGGGCDVGAYELAKCLGGVVNRVGTSGNDKMRGGSSAEVFLTLGGKDSVTPGGGNDRLCLGTGNDTAKIRGGGKDKAAGEGGRDRVQRDSRDVVSGFEVFF